MSGVIRDQRTRALNYVFGAGVLWLPVLLLVFGVLFYETWIQLQVYEQDYATSQLSREVRELKTQIKNLEAESADLAAMWRLESKALAMGMVEPRPGQVVVIDPAGVLPPTLPNRDFRVAQMGRSAKPAPGGAVVE